MKIVKKHLTNHSPQKAENYLSKPVDESQLVCYPLNSRQTEIARIIEQSNDKVRALINDKVWTADTESFLFKVNLLADEMFYHLEECVNRFVAEQYAVAYQAALENSGKQNAILPVDVASTDGGATSACRWLKPWFAKENRRVKEEIKQQVAELQNTDKTEKLFTEILLGVLIAAVCLAFFGCSQPTENAAEDAAYEAKIEAEKDAAVKDGAKYYKVVANSDETTCETCAAANGKVFDIADFEIGDTAPPFHPNCKCTIEFYAAAEETTVGEDIANTVDDRGLNYIANLERNPSLINSVNGEIIDIPTTDTDLGYGHDYIKNPIEGVVPDSLNASEALELLKKDLEKIIEAIEKDLSVKFTQNQFNAIVAMRYNFGRLGYVDGLMEFLEAGSYKKENLKNILYDFYNSIVEYDSSQDIYLSGWLNRVDSMVDVFFDGDYGYMPIDAVNGKVNE
ncbi:MAG: minor capsid protein [Oscillospiraceae bacterium]|jgi:SPP1 gp7 family putative phage head morphogenesis protein|nr:minor capsid protein [Oscillospiraceae bacterium]